MWGSHYGTLQRWAPLICGAVHLYKLYKSWNDLRREFKKEKKKVFTKRDKYLPSSRANTPQVKYLQVSLFYPDDVKTYSVCVLLVMKAVNQDVFI